MSQKIPFLEMFAALRQWTELSNGVDDRVAIQGLSLIHI